MAWPKRKYIPAISLVLSLPIDVCCSKWIRRLESCRWKSPVFYVPFVQTSLAPAYWFRADISMRAEYSRKQKEHTHTHTQIKSDVLAAFRLWVRVLRQTIELKRCNLFVRNVSDVSIVEIKRLQPHRGLHCCHRPFNVCQKCLIWNLRFVCIVFHLTDVVLHASKIPVRLISFLLFYRHLRSTLRLTGEVFFFLYISVASQCERLAMVECIHWTASNWLSVGNSPTSRRHLYACAVSRVLNGVRIAYSSIRFSADEIFTLLRAEYNCCPLNGGQWSTWTENKFHVKWVWREFHTPKHVDSHRSHSINTALYSSHGFSLKLFDRLCASSGQHVKRPQVKRRKKI